jgi:hypothetical protein
MQFAPSFPTHAAVASAAASCMLFSSSLSDVFLMCCCSWLYDDSRLSLLPFLLLPATVTFFFESLITRKCVVQIKSAAGSLTDSVTGVFGR